MFLRTILNTMHRMVYPFLAVFARGLGVEITTLSYVVTARSFFGLFAPVLGSIADHRGRKFGMLAGVLLFTIGMGAVAFQPELYHVQHCNPACHPRQISLRPCHASLLRRPYPLRTPRHGSRGHRGGVVVGVHRGVPLMGFLIAGYGWDAPFGLLAGLGLVMFAVIWWMVPRTPHHASQQPTPFDQTQAASLIQRKISARC
ncbi:MAG: hypothetical protein MZU91_02030 [Desulfosudis oleivorans]|nr:hypothetical protein [Desulfosudis oleivorans]